MRVGEPGARMPTPNVRFPLLRGCALIAGILLFYLFLAVWAPRLMEWVGRGPALITSAAACAIILLALRAMALRVRLEECSLLQWLIVLPLLNRVGVATYHNGLWWAGLGSFCGVFLVLLMITELMPLRRRGGMGVRDEGES